MDRKVAVTLVLALAVAIAFAVSRNGGDGEPARGFEVYHYYSEDVRNPVTGDVEANETFRVHDVHGRPIPIGDLEMRRDGEPWNVTWIDTDGNVTVEDRFWFVAPVFDTRFVLTAHYEGEKVMECRYGAGSANRLEPDAYVEAYGGLHCLRQATQ